MNDQTPNPQDSAAASREPQVEQQQGDRGGQPGGAGRSQAAPDEARRGRDQVRDDPSVPHDESRLG